MTLARFGGAALVAAAALSCSREPSSSGPPAGAATSPPNLLLITLDTTRADAIAPWGPGGRMPNLDALAAESLVAMDARAPAPLTFPSHASMLTGLYPFAHGVRDNDLYQLDPRIETAPQLLRAAGYRTIAILAASVLRAGTGLERGFDEYLDVKFKRGRNAAMNTQRPANEVCDLVIERLAAPQAAARPWFLWAHFFDPHAPYAAPGGPPKSAPLLQQYAAELRFLDRELGRLLAHLRKSGVLENTWILVCADHGEGVGIQQELSHAYLAEEGTLRIPLLVRRPDGQLRGKLAAPATASDVFPTLLAIAGIAPPYDVHGRDLVAMLAAEQQGGAPADALAERALWFETWAGWHVYGWARLEGVIAGRFKYVRNVNAELFDVGDPRAADLERTNLAAARPEILRALELRYAALLDEPVQRFDSSAAALPPMEVARLKELGYLARSIGADDLTKISTLDPRQHYQIAVDVERALQASLERRTDEAVRLLEPIVRAYPGNASFHEMLGNVLLVGGRNVEAAKAYEAALAIDPKLVASTFYLGALKLDARQLEEARALLERTLELSPVHLEAWLQIRALHEATRDHAAALRDTIEVLLLAGAMDDADGAEITRESLESWLPNLLKRLEGNPGRPQAIARALERLGEAADPTLARAKALLIGARDAK